MKYTQLFPQTFDTMQMNAGILVKGFDPKTGVITDIIGATSGGITIADAIATIDLGEDIDNCPKNMKELMQLDSHTVTASGTFVTVTQDLARILATAADIDPEDNTHIVPRNDIRNEDFQDIWFIGDYSRKNTGENAGYLAIHLMNTINTSGFNAQTTDKGKGKFAFTMTACYSMSDPEKVPYEIYLKGGDATPGNVTISLDKSTMSLPARGTNTLTATTNADASSITWSTDAEGIATVSGTGETATVTGVSAGEANITAQVNAGGKTYKAICKVTVEGA